MSITTVNDIEMYYEIHGEGEPLLLIHGLGSSSRDWEYQTEAFAKNYKVIVVDVRGHGKTTKAAGDFSIELFSDDIAKLLISLDIQSVHVVGLSMGGMITFQLAIDHPNLVKSITIVNSGPGFPVKSFKAFMKLKLRFFMIAFMSMEKVGKTIAAGLFPNNSQGTLRNLFVERFIENDKTSYVKSMKILTTWNVTKQLHEIDCPCLILAADKDYTSINSKKNYSKLLKNSEVHIIADSHHALPVEKPEEFNSALSAFLSKL